MLQIKVTNSEGSGITE